MDERRGNTRRRKKRGRGRIYKPVSVVLILVLLILSVSIFFKVQNIEVRGAVNCSIEEVIAASGLEKGENLIFINTFDAVNGIFKALPYVGEATIKRSFPSTVIIGITENKAIASVRIGESYWLMDSKGKLLEKTTKEDSVGTIYVSGITALAPSVGNIISLGETERPRCEYLLELLGLVYDMGIYEKVTNIDMSNTTNVTFEYDGRFTVALGQDDQLSDKLSLMKGVIEKLGAYDVGDIDLSTVHEAHFIPN